MKLAFKFVWERFPTAIKIDPPEADSMFDVGRSMFDVRCSLVSIIDQTGRCFGQRSAAGGTPETPLKYR